MAAPEAANLQALTTPRMFAGISTALAAPLSFVVEAFADAWGFPAAAMLTVLNADGSQSAVPASELSVGSQACACDPLVQVRSSCTALSATPRLQRRIAEQRQTWILHAQHTESGVWGNRC
jgi:hypothetical protein